MWSFKVINHIVYLQCGVIECVPDSKSRDQIGKQTDISLDQYFMQKYGDQDSPAFQEVSCSLIIHG